ncbi:MAG: NHL repeat-containing protein [Candidatus Omnitrophica bacterium]|nr:NHL repeat-containing protein [Candidatus Omnitrophota bacterium]
MKKFLFFLLLLITLKNLFASYQIISDNSGIVVSVFDFCVDEEGNIYVPNYCGNELIKFNKNGEVVLRIPIKGWPWCVSVDKEKNIYVGAQYNKGVHIFSSEGDRKKIIKTESVKKIVVDSETNIYLLIENKIFKYTKDGKLIENFSNSGYLGPFENCKDISVDKEDNIYICNSKKIVKYNKNGEKIKEIETDNFTAIDIDKDNNIYAAGNHKLVKFSPNFEKMKEEKIEILFPRSIKIDIEGNIYISDMSKLMKFKQDLTPANEFEEKNFIGGKGWKDGYFVMPSGIGTNKEGNIIVCDFRSNRIQKLNSEGNFLTKVYTKYEYNSCVFVDKEGNIYVGNIAYHCITKFSLDLVPLKIGDKIEFGGFGKDIGKFSQVIGISIDEEGNIYVAEGTGKRIQKFTKEGKPLNSFSGKNFIEIEGYCGGICVDKTGNIYITNATKHCVMKFKSDGSPANDFISEGKPTNILGSYGNIPGRFNNPSGICVDEKDGSIYVIDKGNARVQKFNRRGEFLGWFGSYGYKSGKMREPTGIVLDNKGYLYITDTRNSRIYKIKIDQVFN